MPLLYAYQDPYLQPHVTQGREDRALVEVQAIRADWPADWLERLTRLRAYTITCQESQRAGDDLFGVKLAQYGKEFDKALPLAHAAADKAAAAAGTSPTGMGSLFSVELFRA